jgi:hypothetical protein
MFIDDLDYNQCWTLWAKIHAHPIKMARALFPNVPPAYVAITKLIGAYASNKGTALALAKEISELEPADRLLTLDIIKGLRKRRDVYTTIAAKIYCDIPAWAREIKSECVKSRWPEKSEEK